MSSFEHPDEGLLLRYMDGELPAAKARRVERHLEACWQCRAELDQLRATVSECVRYRKNVLEAHFPPPPQAWPDLYRGFARIDDALSGESFLERMLRPLRAGALRWAVTAVALVLVFAGVFYQLRQTPSVQAAALLRKAVAAADEKPKLSRRIQIRTRTRLMTRVVGVRSSAADEAAASEIEALFQTAHYSWEDPLSAKSYQQWRDSLAAKHDEVTTTAENGYRIRTTADEGELATASLTLRSADLEPLESRFEFRNREWVELTEIPEPSSVAAGVQRLVEVPTRSAVPSRQAADAPGAAASISEELQVLAALHQIGADLGDPVAVNRSGGRIVVGGVGISPQRQNQIHALLGAMPNVVVQFAEPGAAQAPADSSAEARPSTPPAEVGIQARVEQQLGGHADFERFSAHVLDRNEAAMARAYALRSLAQRFPPASEAGMSEKDRKVLRDMEREHAAALARETAAIQHAVGPLLASLGGTPAPRLTAGNAPGWQDAAEESFRAARRMEVLLSVMLGVARADGPTSHLPSELLSTMQELRANLEECQRLLAQGSGG